MDINKRDIVESIIHWQQYPLDWVKDKFPTIVLSSQQKQYFVELSRLLNAKIKAYETPELLSEVEREYAGKIGISIMAGQGVGKDFISALTMIYFLDVFPYAKITATGVTGKHLRNVLWSECAKVMGMALKCDPKDSMSPTIIEKEMVWQTERIYRKGIKNEGSRWFAEAVTINPNSTEEDQAKTLYGRHEDYQLIVMDEAASIPEPVFSPLEGTLTGMCCIGLMIFNPTRNKGYAYDSHYGNVHSGKWIKLRWNAEESELVTPEHLSKMARYGKDSNTYRVKVLGLPPVLSSGGMFPYDLVREAIDREFDISPFDPVMCGVDAGGGGDRSVVCVRTGPVVSPFESKLTSDPDVLADWAAGILMRVEATVAFVDNIGLGWYLPKALFNRGIDARPADSRNATDLDEPERFLNKRAEMYWNLKLAFENRAISIPNDEELIDELGAIMQDNAGQKVKIGDKKEIRKKIGFSPDKADALAMTYYENDSLFRKVKRQPAKEYEPQELDWMSL